MYHHEACVAYVKQAYIGYKIEKNIEIPKREKKEYARFIRPQSCFWFSFPSSYSIDDKSPHALAQELGVRIMVKIRPQSCFWFPFPSSYSIDDKSPHALAQELGVRIMVKIRDRVEKYHAWFPPVLSFYRYHPARYDRAQPKKVNA
ncbi:hypothetical protein ACH5RR_033321 [Cinchona calisaya]|uniref:Uncharacterized protein n=1 Tax=Cinchona calisaya TaxID=153742 RepID=A0ABD2YPP7_9GENT